MNNSCKFCSVLMLVFLFQPTVQGAELESRADKIVIAHRGASAYLPEHTLEAKVLAYAMGADYIEQDVVMTKDDRLIVFHDLTLDRTTDVAARFPGRQRPDGHYYTVDFTLDEVRQLSVSEAFANTVTDPAAIFEQRFPPFKSSFSIHTLEEEIELIQGLNKTMGREAGIYVELKSPWFFHSEGKDLAMAALNVLKQYSYQTKADKIYLQTFDFNELKRLHQELFPQLQMELKLVQLIAPNEWMETFELDVAGDLVPYDSNWMLTQQGLRELTQFADGIGPNLSMIINPDSSVENLVITPLVDQAHSEGLLVHPFTFRQERIPEYASDFDDLLNIFLNQAGVDGVFTDFPDLALRFLRTGSSSNIPESQPQ